jgi:selenocysteine lyase/cysteine desulfurase
MSWRQRKRLWERHRIEAQIVERPGYLMIRTSTHFYNMEEEVDRLAEALPDVLGIATDSRTRGQQR